MNLTSIRSTVFLTVLIANSVWGMQNVWLDFNPGWDAHLFAAASSSGVAPFSVTETADLETEILSAFESAYAGYTVNFTTFDPGGPRERVDFGAITSSSSLLGQATLDFRNASNSTQDVYVANFDFILEPADDRTQQLSEFAAAVSGTAAHELGHAFGLRHFYAYGDPRITPANYSNTLGFQNDHLMATGSTGLNEMGRETARTFSDWSRLQLELGSRLSNTNINELLELFVGDFGSTLAAAEPLSLQQLNISNAMAGVVIAELASDTDVDFFEFSVTTPSLLTAELWSGGGFFDGTLAVLDAAGALVAEADNVLYSPTTFGTGTEFSSDPWLLNIPLQPGSYFIEVGALAPVPVGFGDYELTLGLMAVPEPNCGMGLFCLAMFFACRWRK